MIHLLSIDLEITNLCYNTCRFCPRDCIKRPFGFLDETLFTSIILNLLPHKPLITLSGMGDPLLHPKVFDFISFIRENGLRVSIVINPNSLDSEKIEKLVLSKPNTIIISFPTINRSLYNFLNPDFDFDDALQLTLNLIDKAKEKVFIKISGLKTKLNPNEETEFSLFWRKFGVKSIFNDCHTRGGNLRNEIIIDYKTQSEMETCSLFKIHTFIDWQGNILACCHDLKGETLIMNVSEGINKLIDKKIEILAKSQNRRKPLFKLCLTCDEKLRKLKLPEIADNNRKKIMDSKELLRKISRLNGVNL